MQQAIAVLDSGVGGLTVAGEIMRQLPKEQILYFGDTARAPYGPRSTSEVLHFTKQIVDFLLLHRPKMIVLACNTATAAALEPIRSSVTIPVIGVIEPGARAAIKHTRSRTVGVIGTEGTIKSGAYVKALEDISPGIRVTGLACPAFVPLVEQGLYRTDSARRIVRESLAPLAGEQLDCLILGCTHYPFLSGFMSEAMGPRVKLINSADETAREISAVLYAGSMQNPSSEPPEHRFFCSGDPVLFGRIAEAWLRRPIDVTQVTGMLSKVR
ncbi:glutamate racemase [Gorillibacterium sp. sgz5001074]|uniref:glutamate racemase n=1 Tax=Gorillibacterium sp. sgz5001074 TaxID=3446695 RepID=UPI003F67C5C4